MANGPTRCSVPMSCRGPVPRASASCYAQRGIAALALDLTDSEGDAESPFEEAVLRVVRDWGYDVVPQVGTAGFRIDMAVRHPDRPGEYVLGIECDGAAYHSSLVARDRDRLRQEVLERLGWTLHRIWGPAWYRSRPEEERRLQLAIKAAIAGGDTPAWVAAAPAGPEVSIETAELDAPPPWSVPYVASDLWVDTDLPMDDPAARSLLETLVKQIVEQEGPIAQELLEQRVRSGWDAARMGARMQQAFVAALQRLVHRSVLAVPEPGFVSAGIQPIEAVRRAGSEPETVRKVAYDYEGGRAAGSDHAFLSAEVTLG